MDCNWYREIFARVDRWREEKKSLSFFEAVVDYSELLNISRDVSREVEVVSAEFWGNEFNYYSNAYLFENVLVFALALQCSGGGRYCEVGVNKGISSLVMHLLAERIGVELEIVGVDPYYEDGYDEGVHRNIDKRIRDGMLEFLSRQKVKFCLFEGTSRDAFRYFIKNSDQFDLIYIDGRHERLFPLADIGSYLSLCKTNGVFMIDDFCWHDVFMIKTYFDMHAKRICQSWKIAAYQIEGNEF